MVQLDNLQSVFKQRAFIVPNFQRSYAWGDDHRLDLLNDLEDLKCVDPQKLHYTGTLVLHKGKNQPQQLHGELIDVFNIVDGQQRITTLVINDRGKLLSQLEKVKNYLLYIGGKVSIDDYHLEQLINNVNDSWQELLSDIMDSDVNPDDAEDQFLHYHWVIYPGENYYEDNSRDKTYDIHKSVKKTINLRSSKKHQDIYDKIINYLDSLKPAVKAYRDLCNPLNDHAFTSIIDPKDREEIRERSLTINQLGRTATIMPLLMASYQIFYNEPQGLIEIFRLAENLIFRLIVLEKYAHTGVSWTYSTAAEVMSGQLNLNKTIDNLKEIINYYCPDQKLKSSLLDKERNFYDWNGIRFFLYEYEKDLVEKQKQPKIAVPWNVYYKLRKEDSIEHILPKGENTLKRSYWKKRFTQNNFELYKNNLGNLTLSSWNSSYSNKGFDEKKGGPNALPKEKAYRNSNWCYERELTQYPELTKKQIEERTSELVEFAVIRWGI